MSDIITVNDLNLWYGPTQALHHVTISVPEHSITALIGPSGCGKSTFLKTLDRMNDLIPGVKVEGQVLYKGQDIYAPGVDVSQLRREVGMVFQKPNPFPMSIYDNVAYGPRTHGIRSKTKLDELVEQSLRRAAIWDEVKDRLKKNALGLSGGQQQRLCIARALAVQPHLGPGPHLHLPYRGVGGGAEASLYHRHRHSQYAAGPAHLGPYRLLPAGRAGGVRRHGDHVLHAQRKAYRGLHHREVWIMRSQFDKQLAQLHRELIEMGALCEQVIALSSQALTNRDTALAEKVAPLDHEIDRKERDIENLCLRLLLQQQPVAGDLRQISAALKMITDMERIGDQADDIAEILLCRAGRPLSAGDTLRDMARATIRMVSESVDAYVRQDVDLAQQVIAADDEVDGYFDRIKAHLIDRIAKDVDDGEATLDLLMIAKYYERIGDHATNIAEWVMFSVTGVHKTEAT